MTTGLADASDGLISELCGYLMKKRDGPGRQPCARAAGHKDDHRDAQELEQNRERARATRAAGARARYCLWWLDVVSTHKLRQGCERCGYSAHAVALDFDHIDPSTKSFKIADFVRNGLRPTREAQDMLVSEVQKCRVLCSNCHRVKTREAGDYYRGLINSSKVRVR